MKYTPDYEEPKLGSNEKNTPRRRVYFPAVSIALTVLVTLSGCRGLESEDIRNVTSETGLSDGEVFQDCANCPELVVIPPGRFVMGNKFSLVDSEREVFIDQKIAIATTETTVSDYQAFIDETNYVHSWNSVEPETDTLPVVGVSWFDATEYAKWLSEKTGESYRLPTEQEWEYAARAGATSRYWWGEHWWDNPANCKDCLSERDLKKPIKVKSFPKNPFGLYETTGNVYEWVNDCLLADELIAEPLLEPEVDDDQCTSRVIRGGSWTTITFSGFRSGARLWTDPERGYNDVGFRLIRELR